MPKTTLSVYEHAELTRLEAVLETSLARANLFDDGLTGKTLSEADETSLLTAGEQIYGLEGINALYYYWKTISANE